MQEEAQERSGHPSPEQNKAAKQLNTDRPPKACSLNAGKVRMRSET
jgi:hypothetical protein